MEENIQRQNIKMQNDEMTDTSIVIRRIMDKSSQQNNSENEYTESSDTSDNQIFDTTDNQSSCNLLGCCKETIKDKYHPDNQIGSKDQKKYQLEATMPDAYVENQYGKTTETFQTINTQKRNKNVKCALSSCCVNDDEFLEIGFCSQVQPKLQISNQIYFSMRVDKEFQIQSEKQFVIEPMQESQIQSEKQFVIESMQESQIQSEKQFVIQSKQEFNMNYEENKKFEMEQYCIENNKFYKNYTEELKIKYKSAIKVELSIKGIYDRLPKTLMCTGNQEQKVNQK